MFNSYQYHEIFLRSEIERNRLTAFLAENGLDLEPLDCYIGIFDGQKLIGGGGYCDNVIKCIAINEAYRSEALTGTLISQLRSRFAERGYTNAFIFTKPQNEKIFRPLAFHTVGRSQNAVLLESDPNGVGGYVKQLSPYAENGTNGIIVTNSNPFTNGHRFLIETAASQVDRLHVFVLSQEQPPFTFMQRFDMVKKGVSDLPNVVVHKGGFYVISKATFPSYFIKDASTVARNQIELDLNVFATHIAPALNCSVRFVGTEPADKATLQYNEMMSEYLPKHGIEVRQIERLKVNGEIVSASSVRKLLNEGKYDKISTLVPATTFETVIQWKKSK